jgi:hypothetical protein
MISLISVFKNCKLPTERLLVGQTHVADKDFICSLRSPDRQIVLNILKERGAPILGNFHLRLDTQNYKWTESRTPGDYTVCIKWRKNDP